MFKSKKEQTVTLESLSESYNFFIADYWDYDFREQQREEDLLALMALEEKEGLRTAFNLTLTSKKAGAVEVVNNPRGNINFAYDTLEPEAVSRLCQDFIRCIGANASILLRSEADSDDYREAKQNYTDYLIETVKLLAVWRLSQLNTRGWTGKHSPTRGDVDFKHGVHVQMRNALKTYKAL